MNNGNARRDSFIRKKTLENSPDKKTKDLKTPIRKNTLIADDGEKKKKKNNLASTPAKSEPKPESLTKKPKSNEPANKIEVGKTVEANVKRVKKKKLQEEENLEEEKDLIDKKNLEEKKSATIAAIIAAVEAGEQDQSAVEFDELAHGTYHQTVVERRATAVLTGKGVYNKHIYADEAFVRIEPRDITSIIDSGWLVDQ